MRLIIGETYNFKNQLERLIYLGKPDNRSGDSYWHHFALAESPNEVWAEVLDEGLDMMEETFIAIKDKGE